MKNILLKMMNSEKFCVPLQSKMKIWYYDES